MLFQLGNRSYHVQAFTILLLVLATIPERANGNNSTGSGRNANGKSAKCYECEGDKGSDCDKAVKDKMKVNDDCWMEYCMVFNRPDLGIERQCFGFDGPHIAKCITDSFAGGCKKAGEDPKDNAAYIKCLGSIDGISDSYKKRYLEELLRKKDEVCVCKEDLCNGNILGGTGNIASPINPTTTLITFGLALAVFMH